jgi:hypothetical protein
VSPLEANPSYPIGPSDAVRTRARLPRSRNAQSRRLSNRPAIKQPIRKPDQQPRAARKYRKRPRGDAGPEISNGLGALLFEARTTPGFGGDFSQDTLVSCSRSLPETDSS